MKGAKTAYDICNAIGQEIHFCRPNILGLKRHQTLQDAWLCRT